MTSPQLEIALAAAGEVIQSSNLRGYLSTTLNQSLMSVPDSSGRPMRYSSGAILKVHVFTCTKRGHYRVSTPQDIQAEARKLQACVQPEAIADQRQAMIEALARANGNRTKAAGQLGIGRNALRARLIKYGIDVKTPRENWASISNGNGAHGAVTPVNDVFHRDIGNSVHVGNGSAAAVVPRELARQAPHSVLDVISERISRVLQEELGPYVKVIAVLNERN